MPRAHAPQLQWIVCYDVHSPRRRRRIARLLEGEGVRLQRSVFRVECTPDQAEHLRRRCQALMQPADKLYLRGIGAAWPVPWARTLPAALPDYWLA